MIRPLLVLIQAVVAVAVTAAPFEDFAVPFHGKDCEVIWEASANYPPTARTFKVVPTVILPETVSNLLQIAELKPNQRKRSTGDGVFADRDVRFFANEKETRQLNLIPSQGFIVINKEGVVANVPKQLPVGVPDNDEILSLALDIMQKAGIRQTELAKGDDGAILKKIGVSSVLSKDKGTGQITTNIIDREISLRRQIDGIQVYGPSGILMKFGNEGKLAYLSSIWRSIAPNGERTIPPAADFIKKIKADDVFIAQRHAGKIFRAITVKKVSIFYWEHDGVTRQTEVLPFAVLEAKTNLGGEDADVKLYVNLAVSK